MTIYVIHTVARQVDGEYVFAFIEKAFTNKEAAEAFWRQKASIYQQEIQGLLCSIERVIHTTELEED